MKKRFLILSFILFQLSPIFAQYEGGTGDGHDVEKELNTTLTNLSLAIIYRGGIGDGHDVEKELNTTLTNLSLAILYNGSIGDGFDNKFLLNTTLDNISIADLYRGGIGDGFDNKFLLNTTLDNISIADLYRGGTGDGFDNEFLLNTTLDNISIALLYQGSIGDGFDSESILNTTLDNLSLAILYKGGIGDGFNVNQETVFLDPNLINIKISLIAFLQGAYINPISGQETLMRDNLRVAGLIPTTSPYADTLTCNVSVFTPTGNDAIVDWVWVELRDKNDNTSILSSQSAFVQRDGDIVSVDGISPLSFNLTTDNYFAVVTHRTHLGVISANSIALSSTTTTVDLSSSISSVNGGNNAIVDLGNGILALYSGDYDGNGQVQNTDLTSVRPLLGQPSSYNNADLDMNTQIQNTDVNNLLNPNKGRGKQYVRVLQLNLHAKRKE